MEIYPIAADSLGTRSMATLIKTKQCSIFIDPGVALGPRRYGLPPHPLELKRMEEHWEIIRKFAMKVDIIIITHYHYDHYEPEAPELYRNKRLFIKHPTKKINYSQKERARYFLEKIAGLPESMEYSDGREYIFKDVRLKFSDPVFHGTNKRLGYVTEVSVNDGDLCFLFTSDVEGPSIEDQIKFIENEKPDIVYLDGPMSYMLGYRYSRISLEATIKNIIKLLKDTNMGELIVDHHLLRDLQWKEKIQDVLEVAKKLDKKIVTAAGYLGLEDDPLEAKRKELYGG